MPAFVAVGINYLAIDGFQPFTFDLASLVTIVNLLGPIGLGFGQISRGYFETAISA